ncbi:MAG TPA: phosphopantetheine-binding protein, partial [Ktedonobacteraceae bacterium]|nr:phosphopantetheine-binding protein [Ktedonobacteraceae bacterium]
LPEHAVLDAPPPDIHEYPSLLTVQEMRHFLLQELPGYMLPSAFVFLEALPLNANGKVDREALPREEISKPELGNDFVAPRTDLEERLAAVWSRLFHVQQISIYDTFFDLGGHSLLATKLIAQLQDTFQVQLPVRDLFENPTIAGLAASLELALLARGDTPLPPDEEQGSREEIVL